MIDSWMQRGIDHFTSLGAGTTTVSVWDRDTPHRVLPGEIPADALRNCAMRN